MRPELDVLRQHAVTPQSPEEAHLATAIYSELTNLAMGRGLQIGGSAVCPDDGRNVVAVAGVLDLVALARATLREVRRLTTTPEAPTAPRATGSPRSPARMPERLQSTAPAGKHSGQHV
jgi:hypothetical protein